MTYYNPETGLKRCSLCKEYLTLEHFPRNKSIKDGYDPRCKTCRNSKPFGFKKCPRCNALKHKNDFVGKYCNLCTHGIEVKKAVYLNGKKRCAKCRVYKSTSSYGKNSGNSDGLMVYCKSCIGKVGHDRRVSYYKSQNTLTDEDWNKALDYFHGCCAVCDRPLNDLFNKHIASADHWIPLSRGGGTTPLNIIPLCHGIGGCNNRKHNSDPVRWVTDNFSKKEASRILARIDGYFTWVKTQV